MRYHPWLIILVACLPAACGQQDKGASANISADSTAASSQQTPGTASSAKNPPATAETADPTTGNASSKTGKPADANKRSADPTTGGSAGTTKTHPADTLVWIGIHARWNSGPGVEYDGNYDTTNQIFVVCSSDRSLTVPRNQIVLEASGGCDTAFSNRVRLMERFDLDSIKTIGNGAPAAVSEVSPALTFKTGKGTKTVLLHQTEAVRIKRTFYFPEKLKFQPKPR